MKFRPGNRVQSRKSAAFTLVEVMVATAIATLVTTVLVSLSIYGARSFNAMSNYVDLDLHSRNALDVISRELREATAVLDCRTNASTNYIVLTNSSTLARIKLSWLTNAGTLVLEKTGQSSQTLLIGCSDWRLGLFTRAPIVTSSNLTFNTATNLASCKLINMSWKCSRSILRNKVNTETVQTAQIVLRNKVN